MYELAFAVQGDGGGPVMPGLIDVEKLRSYKYDGNLAGVKAGCAGLEEENAGAKRPDSGGVAGGARPPESPVSTGVPAPFYEDAPETAYLEEEEEPEVVAIVPRPNGSMNGAGHAPSQAGGRSWRG